MKTLLLLSLAGLSLLQANAQAWNQKIKTVPTDRAAGDRFGWSVDISGDYAIVGAYQEDEDADGGVIYGEAGSAYIYERDGNGDWNEAQKIVASDRWFFDEFGGSVSISGDYAIVGAQLEDDDASGGSALPSAGSAYIFERDSSGTWLEVQKIVPSVRKTFDFFGVSVSISGDYAVVGAYYEDEDSAGANTLLNSGSAYIFERDGNDTWIEVQKIVASDRQDGDFFGFSVAISGTSVIVGAVNESHDLAGADSMFHSGSAYLFERDSTGNWGEVQKILASDRLAGELFAYAVEINGNYAIVGARNGELGAGSAYIFERDTSWKEVTELVASDNQLGVQFGCAVAISGKYAIVGAQLEDKDATGGIPLSQSGAAYMFERDTSGNWSELNKLLPSDRDISINFGNAVGISGHYAIVGVRYATRDGTGGNALTESGAAYLFEKLCTVDVSVSQADTVLTVDSLASSYQWLDCSNNLAPISGETNQSFTATINGSYAVQINQNGCVDTSLCYEITGIGILEKDLASSAIVYPNPTSGYLTIDLGQTYHDVNVSVSNILGQIISNQDFKSKQQLSINLAGPEGFYFIEIKTGEGRSARLKVVKE